MPELKDGHNALITEFGDVSNQVQKIEELFSNEALARKIGENGYKLIRESYTMDKMVESIMEVASR